MDVITMDNLNYLNTQPLSNNKNLEKIKKIFVDLMIYLMDFF